MNHDVSSSRKLFRGLGETAPSSTTPRSRSARAVSRSRDALEELFAPADIRFDGERPWDIRVHNDHFFARVLAEGTLGFGESYMDGWWDCDALDEMFFRAIRARLPERTRINLRLALSLARAIVFISRTSAARTTSAAGITISATISSRRCSTPPCSIPAAIFRTATISRRPQQRKMEMICRKLDLTPGMRLLDIGCGWGGLARYAARHHGCSVVGITISREQHAYAVAACEGLPIEIRLQDYRDLSEVFDRVVSVGMVEHVGYKNYRAYMRTVSRCLGENGVFLCHTIGDTLSKAHSDPWITRYIFPNSMLPSASQISRAAELCFVLEDVHNFGAHYDPRCSHGRQISARRGRSSRAATASDFIACGGIIC